MPIVHDIESGQRIYGNYPVQNYNAGGGTIARTYTGGAAAHVLPVVAAYGAQKVREVLESMRGTSRKLVPAKRNRGGGGRGGTAAKKRKTKRKKRGTRSVLRGRYVKRRRGYPKLKYSKIALNGCCLTEEQGGYFEDPQVCYIGHCTQKAENMHYTFWMAVLRKLYSKHGIEIADTSQTFGELRANNWQVRLQWYKSHLETAIQNTSTFTVSTADSLWSVAASIVAYCKVTANGITPDIELVSIELTVPTSTTETLAALQFKSMKMTLKSTSVLTVQNRTPASLAGTGNDDNPNDIHQQPLYGYAYEGKGNGFIPRYREPGNTSFEGFLGDKDYGIIRASSSSTLEFYRKPPPPQFFLSCKRGRRTMMSPGVIKKDKLSDKWSFNANRFYRMFDILARPDGASPGNSRSAIRVLRGSCRMFSYEKMLDARLASGGLEPVIKIGYQIESYVGASVYYREKHYMAPKQLVGVTALTTS